MAISKVKFLSVFVFVCAAYAQLVAAETYRLPPEQDSVIGEVRYVKARYEDTLSDIARRYGLGYNEIVMANPGVDPWMPGEGKSVLLPTQYILPDAPRKGVVLNVPEMRIYYYPEDRKDVVVTYPVSVGRVEWNTPIGTTKVIAKQENPSWYPPESIRKEHAERGDFLSKVIPPGPDNPLGKHAIRLGVTGYLIHSTNRPYGVGMRVTHGCVRMYPEDIAVLYSQIDVGTQVTIVNQPYKAGWRGEQFFIEAHPPLEEDMQRFKNNFTPVVKAIIMADHEGRANSSVSWDEVKKVATGESGVPSEVSLKSKKNELSVVNR